MAEMLYFFQTSFDHTKAKKEGVIVPNEGSAWSHDELPISRMCTEHVMRSDSKSLIAINSWTVKSCLQVIE